MQDQPTVLLIDDDPDDQEIFSMALEKANKTLNCLFASDGIEALEKLADRSFKPDYIFIDINMPGMNGQQCLAEIKKMEWLRETPVYMYSTSADPETVEQNKRLGATDFIVKSADIYALSRILASLFQKQVFALLVFAFCLFASAESMSQPEPQVRDLKSMSVEELMSIKVTSVSRTPEKLTESASAVQVVTGNDIRQSTAMRLPEAMRLAHNIQIAQAGTYDWGVTCRGFNGAPAAATTLANKLLVMIDGRTVYTPLFGGVFWDVQNVMLEDLDRIEIVSGPGGTLWGSNAVNGVVNVISKSAIETQGWYGSVAGGTQLRDFANLRYGSHIDSTLFFRVYGQHYDYNSTEYLNGSDANDKMSMSQGGFRFDYHKNKNVITFQGDLYSGAENDTARTLVNGQNLLARWTHQLSRKSSFTIQSYGDRTYRNIQSQKIIDEMSTFDIEGQHNVRLGSKNTMVWGLGFRAVNDNITSPFRILSPEDRTLTQTSAFIQDKLNLIPGKLDLTAGTKMMNTTYTGFEIQPSVRLAFHTATGSVVWAAASRSVRTPSRYDREIFAPALGAFGEFHSEEVISYEAGWRYQPADFLSFSLSGYFNQYSDLRSIDINATPPPAYYFANHLDAETYGFELSGNFIASEWLRFRAGYSFIERDFTTSHPATFPRTYEFESIDPQQTFLLHLISRAGKRITFNAVVRYIDVISQTVFTPKVPSYINVNAGISWNYKWLTLKAGGQNLLNDSHHEFGFKKVLRNFYIKTSFSF